MQDESHRIVDASRLPVNDKPLITSIVRETSKILRFSHALSAEWEKFFLVLETRRVLATLSTRILRRSSRSS